MHQDLERRPTRRGVVGALLAGTAILVTPIRLLAEACRQLVGADAGPFYPTEPIPYASDLVPGGATGTLLYLVGRVVDDQCRPIGDADVEIWQCDARGRYKHPNAPKTGALEPGFLYFAKVRSADDGQFRFRTLRPIAYEVFGIKRASHIHVRVKAAGRATVTTEIYFSGDADEELRQRDRVFISRGARRNEMVVALRPAGDMRARLASAPEASALGCEYDVMMARTNEED